MLVKGTISRVAGPFVTAKNATGLRMYELVRVGEEGIIGEVIGLSGDNAFIQVYEETAGLKPGEPVEGTGRPLSVELGPGLAGCMFDGIQRPLHILQDMAGFFIRRGLTPNALDRGRKWFFQRAVKPWSKVSGGSVLGYVDETPVVKHKVLVPPDVGGVLEYIAPEGEYSVEDVIAELRRDGEKIRLKLIHSWPVRKPRPYKYKIPPDIPLKTGQRVIDTFFPVARGGTVAIPGGFGTGKTVLQHTLAKFADADIAIFVGCGERGNEMAGLIDEISKLKIPGTDYPLMNRTVLIVNTSNMPIAAREASVYTGITIAEYYRDMGYDVLLMADSTSRWAEALREVCGRLEEMPGEEGYPAYLATRLAEFYSRAGRVVTLNGEEGSVTVVGAVSPPGGDFSEPVTQTSLRLIKVFWALDFSLAHRRHFPAINWLRSYSMYLDSMRSWYERQVAPDWVKVREEAMSILREEEELRELIALLGPEVLTETQKLTLEIARMVREYFLRQSAFHPIDSYCPLDKTYHMLRLILKLREKMSIAVEKGVSLAELLKMPIIEEIARMKIIPYDEFKKSIERVEYEVDRLLEKVIGREKG
ncbi:MAG: V-type ATP synthase subunit A [Candidatus Bathyarchaeota archaeon]|nr:V-type ATP synthase subunit A [Candidatus Bathyarchaeota archaeon]